MAVVVNPGLDRSAKTALTGQGMDSTRSLKVCCGIRHQDVSSRSFKSCAAPDAPTQKHARQFETANVLTGACKVHRRPKEKRNQACNILCWYRSEAAFSVDTRERSGVPHRDKSGAKLPITGKTGETDQGNSILHRHEVRRRPPREPGSGLASPTGTDAEMADNIMDMGPPNAKRPKLNSPALSSSDGPASARVEKGEA
ncbi:hypothetical protein QTP86_007486 [Hemibagrus guttatus]|nr:hypothetical protein QTP86_007486 [Hemibagrus guttatus]